jgi:uncharacterized protein
MAQLKPAVHTRQSAVATVLLIASVATVIVLAVPVRAQAPALRSEAFLRPGADSPAPADLPVLTQPVNDFAGVIPANDASEIDRRIRALQRASGDVVVVATVDTFAPYGTIDEYAVKLFENHGRGIGVKGKDNGALVVAAIKDRKVRIEVGYDLEQFVTDGYAGETIRDEILPRFRQGDYGAGLLAGTTRIINRIADKRGVKLENVPQEPAPHGPSIPPGMIFFIILIAFFIISSITRRPPRRRFWGVGPWSGWNSGVGPFGGGSWGGGFGGFGGGGGGFGGFGGGGSGGGGASGGW